MPRARESEQSPRVRADAPARARDRRIRRTDAHNERHQPLVRFFAPQLCDLHAPHGWHRCAVQMTSPLAARDIGRSDVLICFSRSTIRTDRPDLVCRSQSAAPYRDTEELEDARMRELDDWLRDMSPVVTWYWL